jgi:hypothetical protein
MLSDFARNMGRIADEANGTAFPAPKYANTPDAFAREVIGYETWSGQQKILDAIAKSDRVSVRSGHRVGKTDSDVIVALWFYATRPGARVVALAPSFGQLDKVFWKRLRQIFATSKTPLGGTMAQRPQTGLNADDGRQIIGFSPADAMMLQGLAAKNLLFILDEASLIEPEIYEVVLSNLAGGGKVLMTGNPNRARGPFFESFKSPRYTRLHLSSKDSPNVTGEAKTPIAGLATREWIEERAADWGAPNGVLWKIRVEGEFVELAEGRLFPPELLALAVSRWGDTPATGRLVIGVDPAGDSGTGDESVFVSRRGAKALRIVARRGLTPESHVAQIVGMVREDKGDSNETPLVVIDRDGLVGAKVFGALVIAHGQHSNLFNLCGVRGSERATRKPDDVNHVRDEVWFALHEWLAKENGAIPEDFKLEADLSTVRVSDTFRGRATIVPKDDMRSELGRSPDRGDALALSCWVQTPLGASGFVDPRPITNTRRAALNPYAHQGPGGMDPYAGLGGSRGDE